MFRMGRLASGFPCREVLPPGPDEAETDKERGLCRVRRFRPVWGPVAEV